MDLPQDMAEESEQQTVTKLHISEEKNKSLSELDMDQDVQSFVCTYLDGNNGPTGATFTGHIGYWRDDDGNDHHEHGQTIEIWVDNKTELQIVRNLKTALEDNFDQYCVCMKVSDEMFIH